MMTLTRDQRNKLIAIGLATLATLLILYFGIISLQMRARAKCQIQTGEAQAKVQKASLCIKMADQYQQELDQKKAQLDAIEAGMASGGDLYSWMIRTVNNFRIAYAVEIPNYTSVRVGEIGLLPDFPYAAAFCNVKGYAHYHDLGKFLAGFENHFPYMQIRNLDLRPAAGLINAEDQEKLNFQMEIVALVSKPATTR